MGQTLDSTAAILAALRLQLEWGADEALRDLPLDRRQQQQASAPARPPASAAKPFAPAPPAVRDGPFTGSMSMDELLAAWAGFEGCGLRATATHAVLPAGDPRAGLLLIGEAPDEEDDVAGAPFAGATGRYLDRMLASAGLDRGMLRLAFLVPWRPPGGRSPYDSELRPCLPFLYRYICLAPPTRLVLFGNLAVKTLLALPDGSRRARGRWRDAVIPGCAVPIPALATHAPAQIRSKPGLRKDAWTDLLLLRSALDEGGGGAPQGLG